MVYGYIRQLHGLSSLSDQQRDILSFSLANDIQIDKEVVEYSNRPLKIEERKEFEEFLRSLREGDMIVISSLSVLSQRTEELIKLINCSLSKEVTLYVVNPKRLIDKTSKILDLFPLLNDLREAEVSKSTQIGRPKGSRSSSKFDKFKVQIMDHLKEGMSVSAIARELEVSRSSLKDYIESRNLRELVEGSWVEVNRPDGMQEGEDRVLICPFEKHKLKDEVL
ncbi:recombinase family protein [Sulfurovum mangrovi]|uniref:recombinase family protein n=1 Tax=Sulfurovum mangrovi TaxID=2893889 RepID=UPI001E52868E|nr:recombinase family protein [Sulfurovum mangrovi]UFH59332.1 recombinase family protein [Sulfurovum mangrovi]